jgi:hypothetical protein
MKFNTRSLLAVAGLVTIASSVSAQSFNIDCGANSSAPIPSNAYGAAANQPGRWSNVTTTPQIPIALKDLATGSPTGVTLQPVGGYGDFFFNIQGWTGDDANLCNDASDVGNVGNGAGLITWTFTGLAAGSYTIYTYSIAPDDPLSNHTTINVTGSPEGAQTIGGAAWAGSPHILGVSYTRHTLTIGAGQNITVLTSNSANSPSVNFGTVNGFQLVKGPSLPGAAFCSGDGSGTACPCGNSSPVGGNSGCLSSLGVGGKLVGAGTASVSADAFVLQGTQMPNSSALYFQGTAQQSGGAGAVFGDGLRCAGGTIIRLATKTNAGGASQYPDAGDPTVSVKGLDAPGNVRTYQVWYRNAAAFCSVDTFNLTNGWTMTWLP